MGAVFAIMAACMVLSPVRASTADFEITKFDADYYLATDGDGRSTLKIVERITAEFPSIDQNHGIERAIPTRYDNHPTSLRIESVTNGSGEKLPYSSYESNDNEVLRIGDADTYVITYIQRDVARSLEQSGIQEFYWDTNGTEWRQPFGEVTVRIHLAPTLASKLLKQMSCYQGVHGSTDQCEMKQEGNTLTASAENLPRGGNLTVALGFPEGTFQAYEPSLVEKALAAWGMTLVFTSAAGLMLIFVLAYRYSAASNRRKELGTVVPEYLPPKDASLLVSAQIADGARSEMVAQILDLSVRHYLKLYQVREKSLLKSAEYELEIIKPIDSLRDEEKTFLTTLFGAKGTAVGARFEMKSLKSNYGVASKFTTNRQVVTKSIKGKYQLRHKDERASQWFKKTGMWTLVISFVTFSPLLLIAAVVALVCASQLRPLTDKGLALRRYLAGLKMYIEVAEDERLKMLQSPEGAEKVGVIGGDAKKLVKLYEKVLPYAVLFGQEKEWNKQLGLYYEANGSSPNWYTGQTAFNSAVFATALGDFSTTTNSYSAAMSSSGGGSSGGGSSGGGGGGGGGGGW